MRGDAVSFSSGSVGDSRVKIRTQVSEEALQMLRRASGDGDPFDIAFIDWLMPNMDGEELQKRIERDADIDDPVIVLLANMGTPNLQEFFEKCGDFRCELAHARV